MTLSYYVNVLLNSEHVQLIVDIFQAEIHHSVSILSEICSRTSIRKALKNTFEEYRIQITVMLHNCGKKMLELLQVSLAEKTGEGKARETCNTWHAH